MKKTPVLHPYFFAVYAVLGVYAQNPQEIPALWVLRPLLFLLAVVFLMSCAAKRATADDQRAGLIATLFLAWLFIGHMRNILVEATDRPLTLTEDLILFTAWTILLLWLGSGWTWKRIKIPGLATNFLNVASWAVILLPAYFYFSFVFQAIQQTKAIAKNAPIAAPVALSAPATPPDVYVVILDAYGRDDFLRETFEYDNSAFIAALRERGFYVAEQSAANYPQTQLSLSSTLNINYLNEWAQELAGTNHRAPLTESIRHSEVRRALTGIGYRTVSIPNSTMISDMNDSDIYLPMDSLPLSQFDEVILSTTVLDIFAQAWDFGIPVAGYANHRRVIQYQLDALKTMPDLPGPKFVFVHILAPHPPFVFNERGDPVQPNALFTLGDGGGFPGAREEYETGYRKQVAYINRQLLEVVDAILGHSLVPPIIILQGDHGPGSRFDMLSLERVSCLRERFSIFNAYYFPDQKYDSLHPTITPVNSFRVIFNAYFGADLPLLDDRSYYASYASPYRFEDVTDRIESACPAP